MAKEKYSEIINKINEKEDNMDLNEDDPEAIKKVNQYLKERGIQAKRARCKNDIGSKDPYNKFFITDCFEDEIEGVHIYASRFKHEDEEKKDYYQNWAFYGYCTFDNIKDNLENISEENRFFTKFERKYKKYQPKKFELFLNIYGGVEFYMDLVTKNIIKKCRKRGISIDMFGFDSEGNYTRSLDIFLDMCDDLRNLELKVEEIKENIQREEALNLKGFKILKYYHELKETGIYEEFYDTEKWGYERNRMNDI